MVASTKSVESNIQIQACIYIYILVEASLTKHDRTEGRTRRSRTAGSGEWCVIVLASKLFANMKLVISLYETFFSVCNSVAMVFLEQMEFQDLKDLKEYKVRKESKWYSQVLVVSQVSQEETVGTLEDLLITILRELLVIQELREKRVYATRVLRQYSNPLVKLNCQHMTQIGIVIPQREKRERGVCKVLLVFRRVEPIEMNNEYNSNYLEYWRDREIMSRQQPCVRRAVMVTVALCKFSPYLRPVFYCSDNKAVTLKWCSVSLKMCKLLFTMLQNIKKALY
uniref:Retrotransposon gag protein n=1 Tax=Heterorhabditis bacteriophora TaxID=37862 RepID=A0A1I7WHD5_HETBA